MRRSELRVIPRHPGSRPGPRKPVSFRPHERHLSGGPAGHGNRAGRKSGAKMNRHCLATMANPIGDCSPRSFLCALSNPSCHSRCVRDGLEPIRVLLHVRTDRRGLRSDWSAAKRDRLSENRGAFHRGNRMPEGIAPCDTRQDLPATQPDYGFAVKSARAFVSEG